jgi:hypothetical protein
LKGKGAAPASSSHPGGKGAGKPTAPAGKAPKAPQKPLEPPAPNTQCKLCGQFYRGKTPQPPTPPKAHQSYLERWFYVLRSDGGPPRVRHTSLDHARSEAQRIAMQSPGGAIWVLEVHTVETFRSASLAHAAPPSDAGATATPRAGEGAP